METLTLPKGKENQIRRIEGVSQIVPFNRTAVEELSEENLQSNETIKAITQPDSIDAIANTLTGTFSINLSEGTEGKDHLAKAGNMARRFGGWAQRFINDRFNIQNKNLVSGRDVTAVWKEAIKADSSVTSLQTENGNLSGIEAIISCETEEQKQALIKSSFDNLCAKAPSDDTFLKGLTQMGGAWTRDVLKKELEQYSAGGNQNLESFVALSRALETFKKGFEHVKGQHKLLDFARKAGRLDKSVETLQKTQVEGAEGTGLTETAGDLRGFYAPIYKDKEGNWKFSPRGLFKGLTSLVQRSVFTPITAGLPWFAPTLLSAGGMAQDGEKSLVNLIQSVINNPQIPENQKEGYVRGLLLKGLDESVYKQRDKYNWGNLPKALIGDFIASGTLATGSRVSVEAGTYQKALEIAEGYFASKSKEISATTTEGIMALAQGAAEAEGYNPTDQELENYVANWSQNSNLWSNLDTTWERKMKSVAFNAGSMFVQGRIMNFAGQAAMQAGSLADQSLLGGNIGASFNLIRGNTSTEFNLQNGDKITTGHSTEQLAKPGQQTIRFGEYQVITSNPENYAGGKLPDTVLQEISAKAPSVSLNSNQLSISNGVLSVKGEDFGLAGNGTKIGDTFGFGGFYLNKGSSGEILNINGNLVMYQGVSPDGKTALFTEVGNPNAIITQSYLMHEVGEEEGGGESSEVASNPVPEPKVEVQPEPISESRPSGYEAANDRNEEVVTPKRQVVREPEPEREAYKAPTPKHQVEKSAYTPPKDNDNRKTPVVESKPNPSWNDNSDSKPAPKPKVEYTPRNITEPVAPKRQVVREPEPEREAYKAPTPKRQETSYKTDNDTPERKAQRIEQAIKPRQVEPQKAAYEDPEPKPIPRKIETATKVYPVEKNTQKSVTQNIASTKFNKNEVLVASAGQSDVNPILPAKNLTPEQQYIRQTVPVTKVETTPPWEIERENLRKSFTPVAQEPRSTNLKNENGESVIFVNGSLKTEAEIKEQIRVFNKGLTSTVQTEDQKQIKRTIIEDLKEARLKLIKNDQGVTNTNTGNESLVVSRVANSIRSDVGQPQIKISPRAWNPAGSTEGIKTLQNTINYLKFNNPNDPELPVMQQKLEAEKRLYGAIVVINGNKVQIGKLLDKVSRKEQLTPLEEEQLKVVSKQVPKIQQNIEDVLTKVSPNRVENLQGRITKDGSGKLVVVAEGANPIGTDNYDTVEQYRKDLGNAVANPNLSIQQRGQASRELQALDTAVKNYKAKTPLITSVPAGRLGGGGEIDAVGRALALEKRGLAIPPSVQNRAQNQSSLLPKPVFNYPYADSRSSSSNRVVENVSKLNVSYLTSYQIQQKVNQVVNDPNLSQTQKAEAFEAFQRQLANEQERVRRFSDSNAVVTPLQIERLNGLGDVSARVAIEQNRLARVNQTPVTSNTAAATYSGINATSNTVGTGQNITTLEQQQTALREQLTQADRLGKPNANAVANRLAQVTLELEQNRQSRQQIIQPSQTNNNLSAQNNGNSGQFVVPTISNDPNAVVVPTQETLQIGNTRVILGGVYDPKGRYLGQANQLDKVPQDSIIVQKGSDGRVSFRQISTGFGTTAYSEGNITINRGTARVTTIELTRPEIVNRFLGSVGAQTPNQTVVPTVVGGEQAQQLPPLDPNAPISFDRTVDATAGSQIAGAISRGELNKVIEIAGISKVSEAVRLKIAEQKAVPDALRQIANGGGGFDEKTLNNTFYQGVSLADWKKLMANDTGLKNQIQNSTQTVSPDALVVGASSKASLDLTSLLGILSGQVSIGINSKETDKTGVLVSSNFQSSYRSKVDISSLNLEVKDAQPGTRRVVSENGLPVIYEITNEGIKKATIEVTRDGRPFAKVVIRDPKVLEQLTTGQVKGEQVLERVVKDSPYGAFVEFSSGKTDRITSVTKLKDVLDGNIYTDPNYTESKAVRSIKFDTASKEIPTVKVNGVDFAETLVKYSDRLGDVKGDGKDFLGKDRNFGGAFGLYMQVFQKADLETQKQMLQALNTFRQNQDQYTVFKADQIRDPELRNKVLAYSAISRGLHRLPDEVWNRFTVDLMKGRLSEVTLNEVVNSVTLIDNTAAIDRAFGLQQDRQFQQYRDTILRGPIPNEMKSRLYNLTNQEKDWLIQQAVNRGDIEQVKALQYLKENGDNLSKLVGATTIDPSKQKISGGENVTLYGQNQNKEVVDSRLQILEQKSLANSKTVNRLYGIDIGGVDGTMAAKVVFAVQQFFLPVSFSTGSRTTTRDSGMVNFGGEISSQVANNAETMIAYSITQDGTILQKINNQMTPVGGTDRPGVSFNEAVRNIGREIQRNSTTVVKDGKTVYQYKVGDSTFYSEKAISLDDLVNMTRVISVNAKEIEGRVKTATGLTPSRGVEIEALVNRNIEVYSQDQVKLKMINTIGQNAANEAERVTNNVFNALKNTKGYRISGREYNRIINSSNYQSINNITELGFGPQNVLVAGGKFEQDGADVTNNLKGAYINKNDIARLHNGELVRIVYPGCKGNIGYVQLPKVQISGRGETSYTVDTRNNIVRLSNTSGRVESREKNTFLGLGFKIPKPNPEKPPETPQKEPPNKLGTQTQTKSLPNGQQPVVGPRPTQTIPPNNGLNTINRPIPGSIQPGTGVIPQGGQLLPTTGVNVINQQIPASLPLQQSVIPVQTIVNPGIGQVTNVIPNASAIVPANNILPIIRSTPPLGTSGLVRPLVNGNVPGI
jgi:hypothetical protein